MTAATPSATPLTPARIMEVGMAFWPARTLLTAIKLGVFTELGKGSMTGAELCDALALHARSTPDFFDTLVALRFLPKPGCLFTSCSGGCDGSNESRAFCGASGLIVHARA